MLAYAWFHPFKFSRRGKQKSSAVVKDDIQKKGSAIVADAGLDARVGGSGSVQGERRGFR